VTKITQDLLFDSTTKRGFAQAPPHWLTSEEVTKLASAVKTTCKKKYGEDYRMDWPALRNSITLSLPVTNNSLPPPEEATRYPSEKEAT
jgi:hypothetical protein